ncbi:hypothetical protein MUN78_06130 [Leucobacter allii]|uniref:3D domain-containing protein n=1 Tax=Leucobacter allii TaxID=2932247 RepID=A0ABY4FQ48_9MICO|nr:hypothetical protein [Leucobacter allii]UOQ58410.1 hypothetical protein MUN78_06130 [Leucobacter allii]
MPTAASPAATAPGRLRRLGCAAAIVVLLGSAAMAPYSLPSAFAADGDPGGTTAAPAAEQRVRTAEAASGLAIDLSVEAAAEQSASTTGGDEESPKDALYTLEQFMFSGAVAWGGYKFTFYSEQVLPGPGLQIPGRHVNAAGYVSDEDGYIVLAGDAPKGTVYETPFGYPGKIYDRGTVGNHLDVYIR